ncbi:hypothetical protein JCM19045_3920 [Bacillus sp. JCM 19045]|nr:hypothetical protein JCM19045_3920 [Bacillus sp. JCM 19045]
MELVRSFEEEGLLEMEYKVIKIPTGSSKKNRLKTETLLNEEAANGWVVDQILPIQTILGSSMDHASVLFKKDASK